MPVLLAIPADPTDLVLQGEHLRMAVPDPLPPILGSVGCAAMLPCCGGLPAAVAFADQWPPMDSMIEGVRITQTRNGKDGIPWPRANEGIATTAGAWVPTRGLLLPPPVFSSVRWFLTGTTRNNTGAALGNCRVVVLDYGQLAVGQAQAVVAEGISDGAGAYSIEVPQNKQYEVICYLAGSPNRAGITDIVTPTQG